METGVSQYKYQLNKASQVVFNALSSPIISTMTDEQIMPVVRKAIIQAYFELNYTPPHPDDFELMAAGVLRNIKLENVAIRINEIEIAFQRGVLKEYGEFMGLSIVSFTQFIKGYIINNARLDALKEFNKPQLEEKLPPSPEEIRQSYIKRLNELFSDYKQKKNLSIQECTFYFKQLWKEKIIAFSPEMVQELKDQALKEVLGTIDFTKAKDMNESKKMREHYDSIMQNFDTDEKVLNYAKYLGLLSWFAFLIETDVDINTLIND